MRSFTVNFTSQTLFCTWEGGALTGSFWFLLEHSFSYSPVSAEMVPTVGWCCSVLALLTFYLTGRFHVNGCNSHCLLWGHRNRSQANKSLPRGQPTAMVRPHHP